MLGYCPFEDLGRKKKKQASKHPNKNHPDKRSCLWLLRRYRREKNRGLTSCRAISLTVLCVGLFLGRFWTPVADVLGQPLRPRQEQASGLEALDTLGPYAPSLGFWVRETRGCNSRQLLSVLYPMCSGVSL